MSSPTRGGFGAMHDHPDVDYCRLYITGIHKSLNNQGLHSIFSKFGPLNMCHINTDPNKRYGFVGYDTPGEARVALVSLNKTPPHNLNISYAKSKKTQETSNDKRKPRVPNKRNASVCSDNGNWNGNESVVSKACGGRNINMRNADTETLCNEELDYTEMDEVQLNLELERIEMLKAQHRYKMALYNAAKPVTDGRPNIHITMKSEGKHIFKAGDERGHASIEKGARALDLNAGGDTSEWSGPGLLASACCVRCGRDASSFCARCRVTPYCSPRCQQNDWRARHRGVCHNLAMHGAVEGVDPLPPMRLPHASADDNAAPHAPNGTSTAPQPRHSRNAVPPGCAPPQEAKARPFNRKQELNHSGRGRFNQSPRRGNEDGWHIDNRNKNDGPGNKRPDGQRDRADTSHRAATAGRRPPLRHEAKGNDEDDWDASPKENKAPAEKVDIAEKKKKEETVVIAAKSSGPIVAPQKKITERSIAKATTAAVQPKAPAKVETPPKCLADVIAVGESLMVSVEGEWQCDANQGYVCVSLHVDHMAGYQSLCDDYLAKCEDLAKDGNYKSSPGELMSVQDPSDLGWYRARDLGAGEPCALLDAARLMPLGAGVRRVRLADPVYAKMPEYSCVLCVSGDSIEPGTQLLCEVLSRSDDGLSRVRVKNAEDQSLLAEGTLRRWRPKVKAAPAPEPKAQVSPAVAASPSPASSVAPLEVERPRLVSGTAVVIVDAPDIDHVFVRPADAASHRDHEACVDEAALYGQSAELVKDPPKKGDIVIAKYTDNLHYRALVTRTHVVSNKYMLEYVEFGNVERSYIERLHPCPERLLLSNRPTQVSRCCLYDVHAPAFDAAPHVATFLDDLKQKNTVLTLTLPEGQQSAASGSKAILTVANSNLHVNREVNERCKPDWLKLQEKGVDLMHTKPLMLGDAKYVELPADGGELQILDISMLQMGIMSSCMVGEPNMPAVLGPLADKMAEYCKSETGSQPYYPRMQELCIAKCPPYESWYRAVVAHKAEGAAATPMQLLYVDFGNVEWVSAQDVRRMPAEFAELPLLACHTEVTGLRHAWSEAMVERAKKLMGNAEDCTAGRLRVTRCTKVAHGMYAIEAPELQAALKPLVVPELLTDGKKNALQ